MGGFDSDAAWLISTPDVLVRYLEEMHRDQWRLTIAPVSERLAAALREYGETRPELFEVGRLYERLTGLLLEHRAREEGTIFPELARGEAEPEKSAGYLAEIEVAHQEIVAVLDQMRRVTFHYWPTPVDVEEPEVLALYQDLREVDGDIRRHMHIEEERFKQIVRRPWEA
jgi:iron-sulfur cluster repair protein YtfE (RIC family)